MNKYKIITTENFSYSNAMRELNAQISSSLNFNYLEKTLADDSFGDGFHLPKSVTALADMYKCETDSIASSATSKRRIDMLFGDTRSVSSENQINYKYDLDYQQRKVKSMIEGGLDEDGDSYYQEQQAPNDVQVRIEKIFSEISSSEQETEQPTSLNDIFVVQHLGSIPLQNIVVSINGLQEPLKELFFKYQSQHRKNAPGQIQIGHKGLQIEYNSSCGGKIEKLYPFSNIAIWASLKFSHRTNSNKQFEYAFIPLVTNSDKNSLYSILDRELEDQIININNVPIFCIVMREPDTLVKQLVCHGFICEFSEDAVVIAATLYRVLMNKLGKNLGKNHMRRRHSNNQLPNRLCSIGETSSNGVTEPKDDNYAQIEKQAATEQVPIPPLPPKRPPRKIKQPTIPCKIEDTIRPPGEGRDILTKITIPRSGSFLNTNRLGSRYTESKPEPRKPVIQKTTASPLGFVEMFNELQSQEGLKTIDDILRVIIKSEGISYSELKPIYKEFLLKLALVLSKDELYHRSRAIMKSQQQKRKLLSSARLKKVITKKSGLKNIFCKPLVKLKTRKTKNWNMRVPNIKNKVDIDEDGTSTDSFMLGSKPKLSELKTRIPSTKNNSHVSHTIIRSFRFHSQRITSTSEDSDYPNINQRKFKNKLLEDAQRSSSSGYFSLSECSYDTESCTCVSADKCYCSMSKNKSPKNKPKVNYSICSCDTFKCRKCNKCYCSKPQQKHQLNNKPSLVEQLKQKGFAVSESSLSPDDTKKISTKDKNNTKLSKSLEYLENTRSSQNHKNRMQFYDTGCKALPFKQPDKYSPSYSSGGSKTSQKRSISSDNLAVDYSMFAKSDERTSCDKTGNEFGYCNSKQLSSHKHNVTYAELARPKLETHNSLSLNENYSIPPRLISSVRMEIPSMLAVYPHTPVRTCSCACSCQIYTAEPLSAYNKIYGSSTLHKMNMENIFGYYP